MDSVLANSQANLALKQRELAKLTEFQLPQNPHLNLGEKHHFHETEELLKITRDLKNELDNRVPLSDPIAQIQQKKIQLLIAERQYTVAEGQIRIIQGHILSGMDPGRSALSRTSDMKTTDELQKQAQPLLTEAAELLKKGRHSVTFAELGARQRMGSAIREQQQLRENQYKRDADEIDSRQEVPQNAPHSSPAPSPTPPIPSQSPSLPPYQQDQYQQQPGGQYHQESPRSPGISRPVEQTAYPSDNTRVQVQSTAAPLKQKKSGGNRCCLIFFALVVVGLLIGGGIYALFAFDVITI